MRRLTLAFLVAGIMLFTASGASAHVLTVTPPGHDDAVFSEPVSRGFAQAHCHAQSPEKATANSRTVAFSPAGPAPCPANALNPGGQTTGP